ncbi:MAG: TIGR03668 family PPOX class F420-dependent oxidoreductase [Thermoplasmata archaeon]
MRWTASDRAFIDAQRVAHLATVGSRAEPHVVPVCFVFDGERFYTAVDQKPKRVPPERLRRIQNLQRNPQVALILDEYREDWERLRYLLVRGEASLVKGEAERSTALRLLLAKYSQYREAGLEDAAWPLIRIDPRSVHRWQASEEPEGS